VHVFIHILVCVDEVIHGCRVLQTLYIKFAFNLTHMYCMCVLLHYMVKGIYLFLNRTYRLFSEYSAMLHILEIQYTVVMNTKTWGVV
jgi:hypothetical protein